MTEEQYTRGVDIKKHIEQLKSLKSLFKLDDKLFETHPDQFRKTLIDNQAKIGDEALAVIGNTILDWFNGDIATLESEFESL